jgi:transposase
MFHLKETMHYYFYPRAADMRKGLYTLSGLVTNAMGRDVREGEVFIFINRTCNSMKILHMECGGLVIYHLRLSCGRFKLPEYDEQSPSCHSSWQELMMMIQGGKRQVCKAKKSEKKQ